MYLKHFTVSQCFYIGNNPEEITRAFALVLRMFTLGYSCGVKTDRTSVCFTHVDSGAIIKQAHENKYYIFCLSVCVFVAYMFTMRFVFTSEV